MTGSSDTQCLPVSLVADVARACDYTLIVGRWQ